MRNSHQSNCQICGNPNRSILYQGPIREGKFQEISSSSHIVYKCEKCKTGFLDLSVLDYESSNYREMVDGGADENQYYNLHDHEVIEKLNIIGTGSLRGKTVADIGCGAGSFVDFLKGPVFKTIAIEPMVSYQQVLRSKGHQVYSYCTDALPEWRNQIDLAVTFAVIEHVAHPVNFLKNIRELLKPEGFLWLSTPNYDDWLLELLPEVFGKFFYRRAHSFYFNGESLKNIAVLAGFKRISLVFIQQYDLSNAVLWGRDGRPSGLNKIPFLNNINGMYRKAIEEEGRSNFIYAKLCP